MIEVEYDSRHVPDLSDEQLSSQATWDIGCRPLFETLMTEARQTLVDQLVLNTKPWLLGTMAGGLVSMPVAGQEVRCPTVEVLR